MLKFYVFNYYKDSGLIANYTVKQGPSSSMKKAILERNYITSHRPLKFGTEVLALRSDLAPYYVDKLTIDGNTRFFMNLDMLAKYPPHARGRKPAAFYATKPNLNNHKLCPHCGQQIKK